MARQFKFLPNQYPDQQELLKMITKAVNGLLLGQSNNLGKILLTANAASTVVTIPFTIAAPPYDAADTQNTANSLGQETLIYFTPLTANAAAEIGAGTMYVSARSISTDITVASTFTITHANNAQTDRKFGFMLVG